jgi:methylated-DNA-protein-cysteine methyltransferase-like protein
MTFRERVLEVVRAVPPGRVVTYGQVATWAGSPRAARQVGATLFGLRDEDGDVPWQRVVNAKGGISTYRVGGGELQVALLRAEGVDVGPDGLDLRRWRWDPPLATWPWTVPAAGTEEAEAGD